MIVNSWQIDCDFVFWQIGSKKIKIRINGSAQLCIVNVIDECSCLVCILVDWTLNQFNYYQTQYSSRIICFDVVECVQMISKVGMHCQIHYVQYSDVGYPFHWYIYLGLCVSYSLGFHEESLIVKIVVTYFYLPQYHCML